MSVAFQLVRRVAAVVDLFSLVLGKLARLLMVLNFRRKRGKARRVSFECINDSFSCLASLFFLLVVAACWSNFLSRSEFQTFSVYTDAAGVACGSVQSMPTTSTLLLFDAFFC